MESRIAFRRYCHVCWYGGRCWRIALTGSFQKAQNWGGILGVGLLGFLLQQFGKQIIPAESWGEIAVQGMLFIFAAWVAIFLVRLLFVAPFLVYREGDWFGNTFVYKEPKLAFRAYVSPAENNKPFKFRFSDAPPFAFIKYKIVLEGRSDLIPLIVGAHPYATPNMSSVKDLQYTGGELTLNRNRDCYLKTFVRNDADPMAVRIYVHSWKEISQADGAPPPDTIRKDFEPARYG
jgi:MFS family permease